MFLVPLTVFWGFVLVSLTCCGCSSLLFVLTVSGYVSRCVMLCVKCVVDCLHTAYGCTFDLLVSLVVGPIVLCLFDLAILLP